MAVGQIVLKPSATSIKFTLLVSVIALLPRGLRTSFLVRS